MTAGAGAERPLGIALLIWLFGFWGGAIVLLLAGLGLGDGPVMLNGRAVARSTALTTLLPVLLPMLLAVTGAALALALERAWARPAVLLPFGLAAVAPGVAGIGGTDAADRGLTFIAVLVVAGGLAWYLYGSAGTRAYYDRLRGRPGASSGDPASP
jgi:hypothetical protein